MSELYDILVETPPTKVILLALDQGLWDCERSLAELSALCEANHMEAVAEVTQKRQTPETGIVLGSGKLEEASLAAQTLGAECAVFDGELTGSQIRNISNALGGLEVIDRTMLILEIFRSRAVTNEGKLQTELALLRYRLPRLQGMGEALSRQGGGGGGGGGARRGAGETKLELDRRHVHARIDALAEKLAQIVPVQGERKKVFFANSGAEADENAVKIAKAYTGRPNIIVFSGAFHGRTMLTMTMTAKKAYTTGMGPLVNGVFRAHFPDLYRGKGTEAEIIQNALTSVEDLFEDACPADTVAAIILEPLQGEGGFIPAPIEFVKGLRKICDDHGILLIADEVQSGFCRTGQMFASQYWQDAGCAPDSWCGRAWRAR